MDAYQTQVIDLLNQILAILTKIDIDLPVFFDTARLILVYGFVIVPLVFVCLMLWWFLRQFLYKY
jgi:hypothetical protein